VKEPFPEPTKPSRTTNHVKEPNLPKNPKHFDENKSKIESNQLNHPHSGMNSPDPATIIANRHEIQQEVKKLDETISKMEKKSKKGFFG
jgi:hypothetical protein